jgi:hypothetical protein
MIDYAGGENLYAFCGNNPITREDPEGTNPPDPGDPENPDLNLYGGFRSAVHKGSGAAIQGSVAFASFNPLLNLNEAASGQDVSGEHVSLIDRVWSFVCAIPTGAIFGKVAEADKAGSTAARSTSVQHHLYPQALAERWAEFEIDYHEFTNNVDFAFHANVIHGGSGPGGAWNSE